MLATVLSDNRRSAYRVRPIATDYLELALLLNEQRHVPHEISDVTNNGASVRFNRDAGPVLSKGEQVDIAIESPSLPGGARIPAKVVFTGLSTTERLIGLAFIANDDFARCESENFFQLFNRRMAYRDDYPKPTSNMTATVMPLTSAHNKNVEFPVKVRNISATGICLDVGVEADHFMHERSYVRLAINLPGKDHTSEMVTNVCYRTVLADSIYYGCHFDWQETPQARSVLEELTEYTHERFDGSIVSVSQ